MSIHYSRTLEEGPMEQLDLNLGTDPLPRRVSWSGGIEDGTEPEPHVLDVIDVAGRRYVLDCRLCRTTRMVLGYSLRSSSPTVLA